MNDVFSSAVVVSTYTRAQAIDDGVLVDVTATAKEAGFRVPVALTAAVWGDCVAWDNDSEEACQDESGRLWDVLTMAGTAARCNKGDRVSFFVLRIPCRGERPETVQLVMHIGPGDQAEPVITIMQPGED
ncbi:MAG: DUF6573 family protein [Sedimenticola sp.]